MIAGGAVYIGSDLGMVFAVDEMTGVQLWSDHFVVDMTPRLVVGQGVLLVTTAENAQSIVAYAHTADAGGATDASLDVDAQ